MYYFDWVAWKTDIISGPPVVLVWNQGLKGKLHPDEEHDSIDGGMSMKAEAFGSWAVWAECTNEEVTELDRLKD